MSNQVAGEGEVFVCGACGKRSMDRYGDRAINRGWDSSCMTHAVLCSAASVVLGPNGRAVKAEATGADRADAPAAKGAP